MGMDVAAGASPGVAMQPVDKPRHQPPRPMRAGAIAQCRGIVDEQGKQRDRIGARPFPGLPALIAADRTAGDQPQHGANPGKRGGCGKAGRPTAHQAGATVWQGEFERATHEPGIDAIQNAVKPASPDARQPLRAKA